MDSLTPYEVAWLVGGAERAAVVTFVALATDGRLDIAYKRQRVKVARAESVYPIEAAALAVVPETGLGVGDFLAQVAATPEVADLDRAVRAKGQLRFLRWFSPTYRGLAEHPGTGVRRVAVLGVPGIEDEQLRNLLEHPLPGVPKIDPLTPVRDNTFDGSIGPSNGTWTAG
ncbi:TIGR04222 domain-containing membrane protein [Kribbella sp. NBC_00709]|uniref:TIGR04222 domain-containing membrane protein n=1 Tax=Kribbella sp. NBC_00709 TaxID=2975972 RepID=UPI002E2C6B64|nr:TIGR04222 domain-containing membrane protein [Kribbella sp. NBC_00709]